jgi:hypothetical protein
MDSGDQQRIFDNTGAEIASLKERHSHSSIAAAAVQEAQLKRLERR